MADSLDDDADLEELVEIGTTLAAVEHVAKTELVGIKKAIRSEAREELEDAPGTTSFDGIEIGRVTVTIPKPKITFVNGTDPEVLRRELGDDFDLYFETKVSYAPRKNATDLVARMAKGRVKELLLCSLEEKDQTPRVSFRKV